MQAQLKQEDHPMDAHTCELDATKAELQACREQLESALTEVQEKAEHVDVMVSYFNDVVEGQLKPQLQEAETKATQLRGEVEALTTELTSVQSQLTNKTKDAERLKEQVATLTSEFKAAKAEITAKDTAMKALEDQVAALQRALHEKSRATADDSNVKWIWVCIVSLVVAVVVHMWSLLVAVMSWTWMVAMSACWKVKTWTKAVVTTDKNDQDVKRERSFVGPMHVGLLLVGLGVLVSLGVATIATKDSSLTHPLHYVTSGPLP
ncbi:hypothetical protein AC1031_021936 [Aphanomyces cochlioides]|nr:hypothetical protein AC1031_021936 [Aphanomyces cochlioides]